MSPTDATQARHWHDPDAVASTRRHLEVHGCPEEVLDSVFSAWEDLVANVHPAAPTRLIDDGDVLVGAGEAWRVIPVPGHADGQIALLGARTARLLAADAILDRIAPFVGVHPVSRPDPLGDQLASLERLGRLDVAIAYPGHFDAIADVAGRAAEIREHHVERLQRASRRARRRAGRCLRRVAPHLRRSARSELPPDRRGGVARAPRAPRAAGRDRAARRQWRARSVLREMTHDHDHSDGHEHSHDDPGDPGWEVKELEEAEVVRLLEEGKLVQVEGPGRPGAVHRVGGVRRGRAARPAENADNAPYLVGVGGLLLDGEHYDLAHAAVELALAADPASADGLLLAGIVEARLGRLDTALERLDAHLVQAPTSALGQTHRATCCSGSAAATRGIPPRAARCRSTRTTSAPSRRWSRATTAPRPRSTARRRSRPS